MEYVNFSVIFSLGSVVWTPPWTDNSATLNVIIVYASIVTLITMMTNVIAITMSIIIILIIIIIMINLIFVIVIIIMNVVT